MQLKDGVSRRVVRSCVGLVVFCAVTVGFAPRATTATITLETFGSPPSDQQIIACEIRLDGTIEENDAKKLAQALHLFELNERPTLCLNSSGGSYEEALAISRLIVERHLPTAVDAGASCLSACMVVFFAGNVSDGKSIGPSRQLHVAGTLGLKEPYDEGFIVVRRFAELYPDLIRKEMIDEMSSHVPDKAFLIDTVGQAIEYSIIIADVWAPREFSEVQTEMLCNVCDNANQGNGHCVQGSRQIDVSFAPSMQLADVTSSFLGYGPLGDQRCVVAMAKLDNGMVVQVRGTGREAMFQSIFLYPWSSPLRSLPPDETRFQSPEASR